MDSLLIFLGGVLAGVLIEHFLLKKKRCNREDEAAKQKIYDTLTAIKSDIETHS